MERNKAGIVIVAFLSALGALVFFSSAEAAGMYRLADSCHHNKPISQCSLVIPLLFEEKAEC